MIKNGNPQIRILRNSIYFEKAFGTANGSKMYGAMNQVKTIAANDKTKLIRIPWVRMMANFSGSLRPAYLEKTVCIALLNPEPATANMR